MSPTDSKATDQSEHNDSATADESEDRRQPDEDENEQKDQQQTKAEKKDEEEDDDSSSSRPDLWKKFAGALPLIFGLGFCVAFFVWVCLQMAGQTVGGPPLLVGIFGASILGILAAGAGVGLTRLASNNDDE
jgi:hypothetical protein